MRTMYDSTNVADDPAGAQLVAYYIDGIYATTEAAVRTRFPNAVLVPISAIGTNAGIVGDQEPGCMDIGQAVAWVQERRAGGTDPTVYVNELYGWAGARQAFDASGVPEPHWWVADYDGIAVVPAGAVAKQYENPPLDGGHFDLSVVADYWPGVDGLFSGGGGNLTSQGVNDMAELVTGDSGKGGVFVSDMQTKRYVSDPGSLPGLLAWSGQAKLAGQPGYDSMGIKIVPQGALDETPELTLPAAFNPQPLVDAVNAVKTELDQVRAGIAPPDLTTVDTTLANVQAIVNAIRVKTDKDLA
jgi:hypothetical protein